MRKKRNVWKAVVLSVAGLLVIVLAGGALVFYPQLRAAASVKKLDEGLYTLTYVGDYGFDGFLKQGGASTDAQMADYIIGFLTHGLWQPRSMDETAGVYGCSTMTVRSPEGNMLFGRNFDWQDCDVMIVQAKPKNGYASVSTCCLSFLGFGDGWKPEGIPNQMMALAAVYVPLDGMNEKGLCVADLMAGDQTETHQSSGKPDVTTVAAIRLLLDKAATVEEALALLRQYDMHSSIGSAHHFALADASGKSVVVEYVDNVMSITETPVVTNFYLTGGAMYGIGSAQSHLRYDALSDALSTAGGSMSRAALLDNMASVAQSNYPESSGDENTQWTLLCDPEMQTVDFYIREAYQTTLTETGTLVTPKEFTSMKRRVEKLKAIVQVLKSVECTVSSPLPDKLKELERLYGQFSVHTLCDALEVSRGSFYNHILRNKRSEAWFVKRRAELCQKVRDIYDESNQIFGAEKVRAVLVSQGETVSTKYVAELMREMGLVSISK